MARCQQCNGTGEFENPAYRELDRLWLKGLIYDDEGVADFWLNRGYNPDNPPPRYSVCAACGGTGGMVCDCENRDLEAQALAAWWEANPDGFVGRLVELHKRNRGLALTLARYAERYAPGFYDGLESDVAAWPLSSRKPSHG